jgi:hypothetical protein
MNRETILEQGLHCVKFEDSLLTKQQAISDFRLIFLQNAPAVSSIAIGSIICKP